MKNQRILTILFLIYFVFAILLNSVGTVILQVIGNYDVSKSAASVLAGHGACKDPATCPLPAHAGLHENHKITHAYLIMLAYSTIYLVPCK